MQHAAEMMTAIPAWLLIPFIVMLLAVALLPVIVGEWWEININKALVTAAISLPTAAILLYMGLGHELLHQIIKDYIPFIILLWGLFAVTGGIAITGNLRGKPGTNLALMAIGALLASYIGTTGAAMLLVRMLLKMNEERKFRTHQVLFFIAIVANAGGLLTPLGDPPLFLLYLRGAEFDWFIHLMPEWLIVQVLLLAVFYIYDRVMYRREGELPASRERMRIRIEGALNFVWLVVIVLSVALINPKRIPAMDESFALSYLREYVIIAAGLLAFFTTSHRVRKLNHFTWDPISEVAIMFAGIFITMTPALLYLKANAHMLGLENPIGFYYATGLLSSFLDNAPTALAFHSVAEGLVTEGQSGLVAGISELLLVAISLGSVLFGAMTYIGNGPNFMVKAIAEHHGVKMPSFGAYIWKFSLVVLLPIYTIVGVVFLYLSPDLSGTIFNALFGWIV